MPLQGYDSNSPGAFRSKCSILALAGVLVAGTNRLAVMGWLSVTLPHRACHYGIKIGEWRSLVARYVRDVEVVGSNPTSLTTTF